MRSAQPHETETLVDPEKDSVDAIWKDYMEYVRVVEIYERLQRMLATLSKYEQEEVLADHRIKYFMQVYKDHTEGMEELQTHEGWNCKVENKNGISVYYKIEPGSPMHSLKTVMTIKRDVLPIVCVLNEIDLVPDIFKGKLDCHIDVLSTPSEYHKVFHGKVKICWPFYHRDAVIEIQASDFMYTKYRSIYFQGTGYMDGTFECPYNRHFDAEIPEVGKRTSRIRVYKNMGCIKPLTKDSCEMTIDSNMDFRAFLPKWLLNWLMRTVGYSGAKRIRDVMEKLEMSEMHQQRMAEKPIYKEWMPRLAEWYAWNEAHPQNKEKGKEDSEEKREE